jgi:hypothetical protein
MQISWQEVLAQSGVTFVAVAGGGFWAFNRTWNKLNVLLREYRLHEHNEKHGPLHAENVRYARTLNSKP